MTATTHLVTGGAGFIGSHYVDLMVKNYPDRHVITVDSLTYAGTKDNLAAVINAPNHTFIEADICDKDVINALFNRYQFHSVVHFAAESHVDNSITHPERFLQTNILGTFTLLQAANQLWMTDPFKVKDAFSTARFHHISTDEVYGSLGETGTFNESTPYAPNSPYSASKASSDFMVRSYHHTYGLNTTISHCSNNFGPRQHDEKLIPTIIRSALNHQKIPIYGQGKNIRDWLYVTDHCDAIALIVEQGIAGETYTIGTHNEKDNLHLCRDICHLLDTLVPSSEVASYTDLISFVTDRPGHDFRYAIDSTKLSTELGWKPNKDFNDTLEETVRFYIKKNHHS